MTFALDIFLIVLLVLAIGYGFVLNRRIVALRRDQKDLDKLAASFNAATVRAEAGVAQLRSATENSVRSLQQSINKAETIIGDLDYLLERGERTADRLEGAVRSGYRAAELVTIRAGHPRRFLQPDLEPEGLVRWTPAARSRS